ncbi:uncharacterized protein LY79DRAFT_576103 [Colletotrichum navitas]|uniref:Uncharacterized protein n=1 Tax=Colletotrichum navitas TaxID=681940 RepID=A0AAD8Q9G0_9PEZI|nr:uncharacterized protein LY79DRAFT_576103 [Colletotrichum navitas]KAK1598342.1 hypothetical protein LY79DRAFT_576103 [Colletotrichum navitas]
MTSAKNIRKRPRGQTPHIECSPEETHSASSSPQKRLHMQRANSQEARNLYSSTMVSVLHRARCRGQANGHTSHAKDTVYQNVPRLFKEDSKASSLRGKAPLTGFGRSVESYRSANLTILRLYDCELFHKDVEDRFTRTPSPCLDPPIPKDLWPYFDVLDDDDTELATSTSEDIRISKQLRQAMEALANAEPKLFPGWDEELRPPYVQIHHASSFI